MQETKDDVFADLLGAYSDSEHDNSFHTRIPKVTIEEWVADYKQRYSDAN